MKRLMRTAGIVGGAVLALLAVVVIGLNLYVQSLGTQARIQQELSQRLGTAVKIRAVSVTPWAGLTLSGITIPQNGSSVSSDFLAAKTFELHAGIISLFSGSLVIKKVALVSPRIVWPQNDEGKWRLPGARPAEPLNDSPALPSVPILTSTPGLSPFEAPVASGTIVPEVTTTPPAIVSLPKAPRQKAGILVPDIRLATVNDGDFRFLDRAGALVAGFEGVDLRATVGNPLSLRGVARVARISVHDHFFLETLHSPVRYDQTSLDLPKITAHAAGGELKGSFSLQPQSADSPFKLSLEFHDLRADQIVSDAGGSPGMIQGKLEGTLAATGNASDANALSGTGRIVLHDGQLQQYSLLVALGQVLQIEELTQLHLEQAEATYHITPGLVTIDQLVLRSPNIRLSATGTINFNGKLHLSSQLAINEKVRGQLFKPIRENFQPTAEPGISAVDFQVSGTLDRPKTNLVDRIVGRDLKDIVSGFLGGKKSDKTKKKKKQENAVPPAGEASPGDTASPAPVPSDATTPSSSP